MRPDFVVVLPPVLNDYSRFKAVPEPLHRQAFITELAVEALSHPVLPWFAGLDQNCL